MNPNELQNLEDEIRHAANTCRPADGGQGDVACRLLAAAADTVGTARGLLTPQVEAGVASPEPTAAVKPAPAPMDGDQDDINDYGGQVGDDQP